MEYLHVLDHSRQNRKKWYNDKHYLCSCFTLLFVVILLIFQITFFLNIIDFSNKYQVPNKIEEVFGLIDQIDETTGGYQNFLAEAQHTRKQIMDIAIRVNQTDTTIKTFIHSVCRIYPEICS